MRTPRLMCTYQETDQELPGQRQAVLPCCRSPRGQLSHQHSCEKDASNYAVGQIGSFGCTGGNLRFVSALVEELPVLYNSVVREIRYSSAGVAVRTDFQEFAGMSLSPWVQFASPICILSGSSLWFLVRIETFLSNDTTFGDFHTPPTLLCLLLPLLHWQRREMDV